MSNKLLISLLAVAGLAFGVGAFPGCGGGSSTQATCDSVCKKVSACTPGGGAAAEASCMQGCAGQATGTTTKTTCSNESAILSAANSCLAMTDCAAFEACFATIPDCVPTTTGNGGMSGGLGGAKGSGGGGSSGTTGGCATCTKFDACCVAIGEQVGTCTTSAECNSVPAAQQAPIVQTCQLGLNQFVALYPTIAACK